MRPDPPFFLFDGECGFCEKWARRLQRRLPADVIAERLYPVVARNRHRLPA